MGKHWQVALHFDRSPCVIYAIKIYGNKPCIVKNKISKPFHGISQQKWIFVFGDAIWVYLSEQITRLNA